MYILRQLNSIAVIISFSIQRGWADKVITKAALFVEEIFKSDFLGISFMFNIEFYGSFYRSKLHLLTKKLTLIMWNSLG